MAELTKPYAEEKPYNAAEQADVSAAQKKVKQQAENDKLVLEMLMRDKRGRSFVFRLLAEFGLNRNPYASNALVMSFACGELNAAQKLQARIVAAFPDLYVQMLTEGAQDD